ncbi:hypothetical protein AVEN_92920-1 [Araneus ventricosus]|uniref:Uncharacterized protein n=1 Tax=Araneus ventricosus TaxID=182803 RepID=A0A4Y2D3F7_ARAVE|nr:hypothetical protein AVEN_92920-1 [Araneus ventricosus]
MGGSGTRSCGKTYHEICELSEHHCGSVAPLHGACLPNWKLNLPKNNASCHKVRIVLEWFEEHTDEFHFMPGYLTRRILIRWSPFGMSWSGSSEITISKYLDFA